jgi:glycosyltransferase involved in cell wall biosynthesis
VVAVDAGGPRALIEDGRTGPLREARAAALAGAMCELAGSPVLRRRLSVAA